MAEQDSTQSTVVFSLQGPYLALDGEITITVPETRFLVSPSAQPSKSYVATPPAQIVLFHDTTRPTANFSHDAAKMGHTTRLVVAARFSEPVRLVSASLPQLPFELETMRWGVDQNPWFADCGYMGVDLGPYLGGQMRQAQRVMRRFAPEAFAAAAKL